MLSLSFKKLAVPLLGLVLLVGCKKEELAENLHVGMLAQVNQLRQSGCRCGPNWMPPVPPLTWNDTLAQAADVHARDMAAGQYLSHISPSGTSPIQRAADAGYSGTYVGENIARGYYSINQVMMGWQASEDHCRAMMDSLYQQMGAARSGDYWVQEFGRH
jgi:uncharacterized protein YkwD